MISFILFICGFLVGVVTMCVIAVCIYLDDEKKKKQQQMENRTFYNAVISPDAPTSEYSPSSPNPNQNSVNNVGGIG